MTIDLIITSYNGRHLLEKHLPSVLRHSPQVRHIYVYDDAGSDDTPQFLTDKYPSIIFQRNQKNLGFTKNTNQAVGNSDADLIVLLNNDVSPKKNYLVPALRHLKHPKVFAVSFAEAQHSWPKISWEKGKLDFTEGEDRSVARLIAWPSGGSCILKKSIWDKLGGYNGIYSPGYWEDIDLGWRSLKQGYQIIWEPKALVDHQHESTFKKLKSGFISLLKQRNELLFTWQNITDRDLAFSHYQFLIGYTVSHLGYAKVILAAMRFYPQVVKNRIHNRQISRLSDKEVLDLVNQSL